MFLNEYVYEAKNFFVSGNFDLAEHRGKLIHLEPILRRFNNIAKSFEKSGVFKNQVSKRVKQQYEENPFPRWEKLNLAKKRIQTILFEEPEKQMLIILEKKIHISIQ